MVKAGKRMTVVTVNHHKSVLDETFHKNSFEINVWQLNI